MKPSVERIAEQFATSFGSSRSRREIRDLADDLVIDLIGALGKASLSEIAEAVEALERRRKMRPPVSKRPAREENSRRGVELRERTGRTIESDGILGSRDPFDITKPSELLDQVTLEASAQGKMMRDDEPPASVKRVLRQEGGSSTPRARRAPTTLVAPPEEKKSIPPRPPAISLREGEQLVRSSGSGVVIRRIRTA